MSYIYTEVPLTLNETHELTPGMGAIGVQEMHTHQQDIVEAVESPSLAD